MRHVIKHALHIRVGSPLWQLITASFVIKLVKFPPQCIWHFISFCQLTSQPIRRREHLDVSKMSVNSGSTPPTRRGRPHRRASTQARRGYEEDTENEANQNNNDLVPRPNKRYKKARDRVTRRDNCRTAFGMPRGDTNEMDSIRNEIDDAHFANNAYQSYARVSGAARPRVVANAGGSTPTERLLMRSWMVQQVTLGRIPGLQWHDEERTRIRIPWVHGSRHTYGPQHSKLFRAWAEHTGQWHPRHVIFLGEIWSHVDLVPLIDWQGIIF